MAKTIKFNLICDEKPVRTIEDLQNNFSIEDVLEYYYNGLLQRWLKVRGYETELEKVSAITTEDSMEIIKELIKIFEVSVEEEEVEESIYMLKFLEERKESYEIYRKQDIATKQIIEDYESGYQNLINEILEEPDNAARIKANIEEIITNYEWVFELNHRKIFWELEDTDSWLAILCLLMNKKARKYFLSEEKEIEIEGPVVYGDKEGKTHILPETIKNDKSIMYSKILVRARESRLKDILGDNLKSFSGITDGYWKDLEPKGKKYMILKMQGGDFVRSAGVQGGDLSSSDVNGKFVIVDGIDYKSNNPEHELWYMEV